MTTVCRPDPAMLAAAASVATPAVIYDLAAIRGTVRALRDDLAPLGPITLCFAVKANRCPAVLRQLARLGLGADLASPHEHELALAAGLQPRFATAPALALADMARMLDEGTQIDLDSLAQLREWARRFPERRAIGLRLRLDRGPAEPGAPLLGGASRFGVDATSPDVHSLLAEHALTAVRLHVHAGELATARRARQVAEVVVAALDVFPDAATVNLGGGWTRLYADPDEARRAWASVADALARARRSVALVLEPGMLITLLSGYLVTEVQALDTRGPVELATLDASAWNLMPWSVPRVAAALPPRAGATRPCLLAGCTCYESDYFGGVHELAPLARGDRLVLTAAGAYVTAAARRMHGQRPPREWVWDDGRMEPAESGDA